MDAEKDTIFRRNRKKTLLAVTLVSCLAMVAGTEILLEKVMGLGNPVIYDVNPAYGYRPLPNRSYRRFGGLVLVSIILGCGPRPISTPIRPARSCFWAIR